MTDSATFTTPEADDEDTGEDLGDLLLEVLPSDGSTIGNLSAREAYAPAIFKRGTFIRCARSLVFSSPYFAVVAVAESTLKQFLLVFPESGSSVLKSMRLACVLVFLILFPCSSTAIAQLRRPQGTLTAYCTLQVDDNGYKPSYIYKFNFKNGEGSYSLYHGKLEKYAILHEFKFTSDYFPSPERYLYWQSNDVILGRPRDSYSNFNLEDLKKEALMLFYERYRYDIKTNELQMIRRGFKNWDKGEASEIPNYWQSNEKWKCSKIN